MKMITRVNINFKKSANNRFGTRYSLKYGLGSNKGSDRGFSRKDHFYCSHWELYYTKSYFNYKTDL